MPSQSDEKQHEKAERKRAKKKPRPAPDLDAAPVASHQGGVTRLVHRSLLVDAPFNPRAIGDKEKKRLKEALARHKYLDRIVWNESTSHIVSGHQRLAALDSLEKTKNYRLEVTVVQMSEAEEMAACISANNPCSQGFFTLPELGALFKDHKVEPEAAGFDAADVYSLFGTSPLAEKAEDIAALAETLRGIRERQKKSVAKEDGDNDPNYYAVVVFRDRAGRKAFLDALGIDETRYIDGRFLSGKLGVAGEGAT